MGNSEQDNLFAVQYQSSLQIDMRFADIGQPVC
jgi:hypothetical protein